MLKNVGSNWIVTLVTIAVTYFLMPFVLHTLGQDGYGTWALINSITGYLALLALASPWHRSGTSPSTPPIGIRRN